MSQAPSAKSNPTISLADAIAAIGRGDVKATELSALSDLSRAEMKSLASAWPSFSEEQRISLLRQLDELSESNVALLFGRVHRIALGDPSPVVRQLAIAGLWEDESLELVDVFVDLVQNDSSVDVRAEAASALGKYVDKAAMDELDAATTAKLETALLEAAGTAERSAFVRRKALEQIPALGRKSETDELIRESYDADDTLVRASALFAMGRSLDLRWLSTIIAEFESDDAEIRFEAARASGELGHVDAVSGLSELALDVDPEVRLAAVIALGKIGGPGAIRVLQALAQSGDQLNREAIDDALAEAQLVSDARRT